MKKLWKTVQAWFLLFVRPILEWMQKHYLIYEGSSRPEVFCWKGILKYFTKFTGKHLCQSLFFNKIAGLRPATLLKKGLWHRCFLVNFVTFLRTLFTQNTSGGCFWYENKGKSNHITEIKKDKQTQWLKFLQLFTFQFRVVSRAKPTRPWQIRTHQPKSNNER